MQEEKTERLGGGNKIEYNHMTSTFSTAVTAHPAGGKSDSYSINSVEALQHGDINMNEHKMFAHDSICTAVKYEQAAK